MNYFYINNNNFVLGYTNLKTADELKKNIPKGCRFFYYKIGDNLELIAKTNEPAGIGTGLKIDY